MFIFIHYFGSWVIVLFTTCHITFPLTSEQGLVVKVLNRVAIKVTHTISTNTLPNVKEEVVLKAVTSPPSLLAWLAD